MSSQRGDVAAKLLFLLVAVAIVATIASPWLLRSYRSNSETKAISTLRRIHLAQADHYGASSLYGSMARLRNSNFLEGPFQDKQFEMEGYKYFHSTDGTLKRFCAEAVPEGEKPGKSYGIDESGVVLEFERTVSPCFAGELTKTGGSPVR
jgi:type II secretory pathway pseudopilin PulG